jgi:WD40 repeat protein
LIKIKIWNIKNGSLNNDKRHNDWIKALTVLSSDDLVSSSDDDTIKIWSSKGGILKRTLKGYLEPIEFIEVQANDQFKVIVKREIK